MTLWLRGHGYRFEMANICRLFLPQEKIRAVEERPEETEGVTAETGLERGETATRIVCRLRLDDFDETLVAEVDNTRADYRDACELQMATLLYQLFVRLFGYAQAWGIVTGVRPVKLLRRLILQDGEEAALRYFREALLVDEKKTALCRETLSQENQILDLSRPDSFSLYISIPCLLYTSDAADE